MDVIATIEPRGEWLDAILSLPVGGWIAAGYESGLVTHGRQRVEPGGVRLRALPVLAGAGRWLILADDVQACGVRLVRRTPGPLPAFARAPNCTAACVALPNPKIPAVAFEPDPGSALAYPATGAIVIDPDWWDAIPTVAGRLGILGHEYGHILGARCQACADYYAGRYLAAFGLSHRDAVQAFDTAIRSRRPSSETLVRGLLEA